MISFFKRYPWMLYPLYMFVGCVVLGLLILLILGRDLPSLITLESIDPPVVSKIISLDEVIEEGFNELLSPTRKAAKILVKIKKDD